MTPASPQHRVPSSEKSEVGLRDQSCRSMLEDLRRWGELLVVDDVIDPVFDLSALFSLTHDTHAVIADRVKGFDIPVFGNLLANRDRIALALDVPRETILQSLLASVQKPVAPVVVQEAPVQAVVLRHDVLTRLPVPTFFSKETGPYITAGFMVARDPETGLGNA